MDAPARPGDEAIPNEFRCPITQDVMVDPVMAADGHTYDRREIEHWFTTISERGGPRSGTRRAIYTSPMTNRELPNRNLVQNFALRSQIISQAQRRAAAMA